MWTKTGGFQPKEEYIWTWSGAVLVEGGALALDVGGVRPADIRALVPLDTEPAEGGHQLLGRARDKAVLVGVLDAEDERAALALARRLPVGEERVVHGGLGAADVDRPGRA